MANFMFIFLKMIWAMQKIQSRWFQIKIVTPEFTQISNSNEDLLWDVADNSINYC